MELYVGQRASRSLTVTERHVSQFAEMPTLLVIV